ncbi:sigma-54-dependent Fis family transcriptional regulator [Marinobacter salarius]|jgi:transcriptional regulator of acetoin/glycerol metabolism|uniref:sigma-54-dependent Fis family transcriptional regulator n=1 Tax=Marinobacter TaxID=2742 RepID=UPI0010AA44F6|nr:MULTISPECIES: sigma-54-dependent Fis family transcriptional regulator [Marinobacter]MBJ7298942.1 sigma-54-dependent Fis family transcriptional regulator [Marinobacter salarius]MCC4283989.1 sigma-54-dependent Fis family transcriptional regulator [Marinobacter salarius]HIO31562.1 sigma-54-dependent Fis family transcriptional regulator [Marinobacter salarius]HIO99853.1 sigma-54-dependent Fis family transcriptional regulator [Marinobacter salarius]
MNAIIPADHRRAKARETFFEHGQIPTGLIDDAIVNSWQRCSAASKNVSERVQFDTVSRSGLLELMDSNQILLEAATQPLEQLGQTVNGAGYSVLLTDDKGVALAARRSGRCANTLINGAFRQGVNLSEATIGTSAMSCAVSERRPVLVSGVEHYLHANRVFNCAASPIVDPMGRVLGAIDITRGNPLEPGSALSLVQQCSARVERQLMGMLSPWLMVSLGWEQNDLRASGDLLVALGQEGQVLGLSPRVRELTGLASTDERLCFQDLFDLRFDELVDGFRGRKQPMTARMHSGLSFSLRPVNTDARKTVRRSSANPPAKRLPDSTDFGDPAISRQATLAGRAMEKGLPVLILGETGTGKEVMAKSLHSGSMSSSGTFVAINCAAIPESLIEGELFGHAEGAYTGARRGGAPGKIEHADGGTLFLDEIGDMPLGLQSRLLRVLETREVTRLGSATPKPVRFQLICATHRNLSEAAQNGDFREDLLYRIKGMTVRLPRLAERSDLKNFIVDRCRVLTQGSRELSQDCLDGLIRYDWPGNVRELIYALTHADALAEPDEVLELCHFPEEIAAPTTVAVGSNRTVNRGGTLKTLERAVIDEALAIEGGNVSRAAKRLGIGRATLYRRFKAGSENGP